MSALHVRSAHFGQTTVIVDASTGRVDTLLGFAHHLWLALARTGDLVTAALAVGIETQQADHLVQGLCADGLLETSAAPCPWEVSCGAISVASWGTQEVRAGLPPRRPLPKRQLVLAVAGLVVVLLMRHAGLRRRSFIRMISVLRAVTRRPGRRASWRVVEQAIYCVRQAAYVLPCRIACLEESVAVMLVLAATGQSAVWCHGVAADPIRLHAWLTVDGVPVAEPSSTARYTPLFVLPDAARVSRRKDTG